MRRDLLVLLAAAAVWGWLGRPVPGDRDFRPPTFPSRPAPAPVGTVSGQVVDAVTGCPVQRATLLPPNPWAIGELVARVPYLPADGQGWFKLTRGGPFRVSAPHYEDRSVFLEAGSHQQIRLMPVD